MRLIVLFGSADGKAIEWGDEALPKQLQLPLGKPDPELGMLHVNYRLFAADDKEAMYVPSTYRDFDVIKELLKR